MCKQGTTLIELIVVMGAFILMLLLGIKIFSVSHTIITRLEIVLLSISIRGARQKALLLDTDQKITFYENGSGYYDDYTDHHFIAGVSPMAPPEALGPPALPRHIITEPITFPHSIQSGSIYLGHAQHNCFYALTSGVAQIPFLRLYKYRLNWISL
jgi:hypothetical protein